MGKRLTITYNDITLTIKEWAYITGLSTQILRRRLAAGWEPKKILFEPIDEEKSNGGSGFNRSRTICWTCKRAAGWHGGCNWSNYCRHVSKNPIVEGWEAEEHHKLEGSKYSEGWDDDGLTYTVHYCPEYVDDKMPDDIEKHLL